MKESNDYRKKEKINHFWQQYYTHQKKKNPKKVIGL
jgi:hypothetical protein